MFEDYFVRYWHKVYEAIYVHTALEEVSTSCIFDRALRSATHGTVLYVCSIHPEVLDQVKFEFFGCFYHRFRPSMHMNVNLSKSKMESPRWVTTNQFNEAFAKFRRLYDVHTVPVIFSTIPRFWPSIFWTAKRLNFCTVKVVSVNGTAKRTMQIFVRCGLNYVYYVLSYNLVSLKLVVHIFTSAKPDTSQKNIFSVIQICWSQ